MRELLFRIRGFTPLPFIVLALIGAEFHWGAVAIGLALTAAGEGLRVWSHRFIGGATRTRSVGAPALVTEGPYAYVRNPLYLGNMLIYLGYGIGGGAWLPYLPITVAIVFAVQYGMIISLEERTLLELFGEPYISYQQRVPRLFPKLSFIPQRSRPTHPLSQALRSERDTLGGLLTVWVLLSLRWWLF